MYDYDTCVMTCYAWPRLVAACSSVQAHKELQETHVLLENELQATGAQLHSAENRHWAAIEKLQEENLMLQKVKSSNSLSTPSNGP